MHNNASRLKNDLEKLIELGKELEVSMLLECYPDEVNAELANLHGKKADNYIASLPDFNSKYESWYSEAKALLSQLLPGRVADFVQHYEPAKNRKEIDYTTYRIRDYLQSTEITRGAKIVVGRTAAEPHFRQQLAIVEAALGRFESSLFEIRQILQADLMDSELAAAEHLARHKFYRAAGALAGVILERHLAQVCKDHALNVNKKNPTINDFNELLRSNDVIGIPDWRFIQHLADIRNLCDHSKVPDPTGDQVLDLLLGVKKVMKTVN